MSIFSRIKDAIFGHKSATTQAETAPTAQPTGAATAQAAAPGNPPYRTDPESAAVEQARPAVQETEFLTGRRSWNAICVRRVCRRLPLEPVMCSRLPVSGCRSSVELPLPRFRLT